MLLWSSRRRRERKQRWRAIASRSRPCEARDTALPKQRSRTRSSRACTWGSCRSSPLFSGERRWRCGSVAKTRVSFSRRRPAGLRGSRRPRLQVGFQGQPIGPECRPSIKQAGEFGIGEGRLRAPFFICAGRGPSYNKVMAGVPAAFGIAVPGAAMCHPTSCNARRDCGVVA